MLNLYSESQRWKSEGDLLDSTSDLERLFFSSTIGMALLDTHGRFLSANGAFCATSGYSDEELLDMRCGQLLSVFNQKKQAGSFRPFEREHSLSCQTEQILLRKDRSLMPARVWISSLDETSLEDSLSLMVIEDITRQKEAEQELSKRQIEVEMLASRLIQAQETERKRLARELHDDIGQRLSLVASEVALMASQSCDDRAVATNRLDSLRDELDSLCSDIHGISHELHSYKLEHMGLKSALKDLCRRLTQAKFHVNLDVDDMDEPASKEVSLCLYRVVQEALNNAFRHAHAMVVAVTITKLHDMFYMTIQDTGIGFDTSVSPHGLGLISMNERLKLVKGELRLDSILGRGTEIWVAVPDVDEEVRSASTGRIYSLSRSSGSRSEVA
jgi:PAS domain S-box-containing protein